MVKNHLHSTNTCQLRNEAPSIRVSNERTQQGAVLLESRYLYDPPGRRIGKRVWKSRRARGSLSGRNIFT